MKKSIWLSFVAWCFMATGLSQGEINVTVEWDARPAEEEITSYSLKHALVSGGPYTTVSLVAGDVLTATHLIPVDGNTNYWIITATNQIGEGPNSNEVSLRAATPGATTLRIQGVSPP